MKTTNEEGHFFQIPNNFWTLASNLDVYEQHIYLYLVSKCYGDKNVCYPTQETIAEETHIPLRTVKRKLGSMIERGVVTTDHAINIADRVDSRQLSYTLVDWEKIGACVAPINRCQRGTKISASVAPRLVPEWHTKNTNKEYEYNKKERKAGESGDTSKTEQTEAMITTEAQGKQGEGDETSKHTDTKDSAKKRLIAKISSWMENFGFNASDRQQSAFAESGITEAQLQSIYDNIQHWGRWVSELNKKLDNKVDGSLTIMQKNYHKFLRWLEPEEKALSYEEQEKININLKQSVKRLCEENGIWDQDECWKWVNDNNNVPWIEDKMDHIQSIWLSRFDLTIKDGKLAFGRDILTKDQIKSLSKENIQATVRKINGEVRK